MILGGLGVFVFVFLAHAFALLKCIGWLECLAMAS